MIFKKRAKAQIRKQFCANDPLREWAIIGRSGNIYRKSGATLTRIPNPAHLINPLSTSMAVDSKGNIFVGYTSTGVGKGVFYTKDFGVNWTFAELYNIRVSQLIA